MQIEPGPATVVVLGEVLWDIFGETRRLGGAPLNFAAHARRLGHAVSLISGLGADQPGRAAAALIARLGLDTRWLQQRADYSTGTAEVQLGADGAPAFRIVRPAAYDAVELSGAELAELGRSGPQWFYFGSLFAAADPGRRVLERLLDTLGGARRFLDLNLRPGSDAPELVLELLARADVVKLNEDELARVQAMTGLPAEAEAFCRAASEHYGWSAVSITRGERGCALLTGSEYVEASAHPVIVADTVGAGDAFAAAFMHGLNLAWPAGEIAAFANRMAAEVAGRHGSLPDLEPEQRAD
jgi:fructokinase